MGKRGGAEGWTGYMGGANFSKLKQGNYVLEMISSALIIIQITLLTKESAECVCVCV